MNKMEGEGKEGLELVDEVEEEVWMEVGGVRWGMERGGGLKGV